jgi:kynureninase
LDDNDPLTRLRDEFLIPSKADLQEEHPEAKPLSEQNGIGRILCSYSDNSTDCRFPDPSNASIYLCGNSLGLQPKRTRTLLNEELSIWGTRGVNGHFNHPNSLPWISAAEVVSTSLARVVGALPSEVAVMGSLTEDIHILFASFYKPSGSRTKIIIEGKAFPSDHYAMESQIAWHGLDPKKELVCIHPTAGSAIITTEQILKMVDEHASTAAVLFLSGLQYYTGQAFDIPCITAHAQAKGITVGWDLAHAAGNLVLELHKWNVDFAAWCSYKYINSGPGGIAGVFIHDRHTSASEARDRLAGWWGNDPATRFQMNPTFVPAPGAKGFQLSNPCILSITALRASLEVFSMTSMKELRNRSMKLTGYLEHLLIKTFPDGRVFTIITPGDMNQRGAQLSLLFKPGLMMKVFNKLAAKGVVVDERKPDVIRVAPTPLYNTYVDCWTFVDTLKRAVEEASS